jgi:hypothetical protein
LERGLKPLSNGCLGIIIKINLTTNYQLLLNCNKVHRARAASLALLLPLLVFPDHDQEAMKDQIYCYREKDAPFNDSNDWISPGPKFWSL